MSTESHKPAHDGGTLPVHDTVAFEEKDVKASTIYVYLMVLAAAVIVAYIASVFILRTTVGIAERADTPPPPVRQEMGAEYNPLPPEPRLQGVPGHLADPQLDLRRKLKEDIEGNEKVGWIDESAGIAQIPVKDAMKIIAEKGLPDVAASPAGKKK
jgi:hypothetical protein